MGKQRQTALILGEGSTEFFYFKSLCDVFKRLTIKPDYPKHTNFKEFDAKIAESVAIGYSQIFCIIVMETKD
ncbi:MAG: RloB domain-containing protein, partial [Hoylesella buccalis]